MSAAVKQLLTLSVGLTQSFTQQATNGLSPLGTFGAPRLSPFLTNNPLSNGRPWGTATANNTNPYTSAPVTGVIRPYEFTIRRGKLAPDGFEKDPLIEANWGDTIQVTVHNQIDGPPEGTAMHWHGPEPRGNDGVPSVQQCSIAPGSSFTYSFVADLHGTSWYHSHYSTQYAGGLHGRAMVIHGPKNVDYDIDVGPVFVNDWYHDEYFEIVRKLVKPLRPNINIITDILPPSDNNLINGKMNFDCSIVNDGTPCTNDAGISKFLSESGKTHRLRLINSGAEAVEKISVDGHTMTVIANDFVEVQPYDTSIVTLGIGHRTDVIVKATGAPTDAVWMRATISKCTSTRQPVALAAIYYENADNNSKPASTAWSDSTDPCANDDLTKTVPFYPITPNPSAEATKGITITGALNRTGHFNFLMNRQTFRANHNYPLLLLAQQGNTSYPDHPEWNVYNFGVAKTIRLVVYNKFPAAHPMHVHGHNFFVLAMGLGHWNGQVTNANNPQRRDVQMLPAFGYMVIQIDADNPGIWPFHCHIAWHVSGGLYVNIMERPADIKQMEIPHIITQTCTDWKIYSDSNVVIQIDSGL